jgi:hypothetical protein
MAEQRLVWAGAAFTALVAVAMPHLKGMPGDATVAIIALYIGFVVAVPVVLGAAAFPGDLAGRRLGFYLARPVSTGTLLAGRLLGIWLLTLGGGAVVLLPYVVLHFSNLGQWAGLLGFGAGFSLYALLLGHVLGMAWRSRSLWILLDLAALGGFGWAAGSLIQRLMQLGAYSAVSVLMGGFAVLALVVLAAAAYFGLERGRENLQRGHRVLALVLAGGLAATALAGLGFKAWVGAKAPTSLDTFEVMGAASRGEWMIVMGEGRFGRLQSMALNAATEESVEVPSYGMFSGDGRRYAWVCREEEAFGLAWADLGGARPRRGWTRVFGAGASCRLMALSEDGGLAAVQVENRLLVVDCGARRVVGNLELKGGYSNDVCQFLPNGTLCLYPHGVGEAILERDPATGAWTETGRIPAKGLKRLFLSQDRLLLTRPEGITVCEARTGAVLGRVEPSFGGNLWSPVVREDGSLAVLEGVRGRTVLRVLAPDGREIWSRAIVPSPTDLAGLVEEPGTGRILINCPRTVAPAPLQGDLLVADPRADTLGVEAAGALLPLRLWGLPNSGPLALGLRLPNAGGLIYLAKDRAPRIVLRKARWAWKLPYLMTLPSSMITG